MFTPGAAGGGAISIHAPRVGSDALAIYLDGTALISIHAPRVGSDRLPSADMTSPARFQSTLPVWGATSPVINGSPFS